MKRASNIIAGVTAKFSMVQGKCMTHGHANVLVRDGDAWHCLQCFEALISTEEHAKWTAARNDTLMKIAKIPVKYVGQRFPAHTSAQKVVRGIAKTFRDFIVNEKRWAALILMGEFGTGKTLLACEFGESLIKTLSQSVRYITTKAMISEIQATYGVEGKSEEVEIERFVSYDLLILDEIDVTSGRENSILLLTEIINRRYNNDKPVIVIMNQPFDNLMLFVGDRVADRLHENAFVCAFEWPSFRRNPVNQQSIQAGEWPAITASDLSMTRIG